MIFYTDEWLRRIVGPLPLIHAFDSWNYGGVLGNHCSCFLDLRRIR
ncbi:hypothetical protein [Pasteuria penetrans]|nr:hypothetical protein [Pasteuria penetrans]